MTTTQVTLTGAEADVSGRYPTTIVRCVECGERVLRSRVRTHAPDHDALPRPRWSNEFAWSDAVGEEVDR
jgi:hypothetical protein